MRVVNDLKGLKEHLGALALGMFDGVHLGHRFIIQQAVDSAKAKGKLSAVMTFYPHPVEVFGGRVRHLASPEHRRRLMAERGVDVLIEHTFDEHFSSLSPRDFVQYLKDELGNLDLVVGFNYTFGHKGSGDVAKLCHLGEEMGLRVHELPPVLWAEEVISSTRIRKLIESGELETAALLLARPVALQGVVSHGDGRGRTLGFPTANVFFSYRPVLPPYGVYVVKDASFGYGVANLGVRPTYPLSEPGLEVFFLKEPRVSLYGEFLDLEIIHFLRGEVKFPSAEALQGQVSRDIAAARRIVGLDYPSV